MLRHIANYLERNVRRVKARLLTNHAYSRIRKGDLREAGVLLEEAMEIYPANSRAHQYYACVNLMYDQDLDVAERHLQTAVQLRPNNAELWNNLAYVYSFKKDSGRALASAAIAEELDPSDTRALLVKVAVRDATNASTEEIKNLVDRARKIYQEMELPLNGTPLAPGELEGFLANFKSDKHDL